MSKFAVWMTFFFFVWSAAVASSGCFKQKKGETKTEGEVGGEQRESGQERAGAREREREKREERGKASSIGGTGSADQAKARSCASGAGDEEGYLVLGIEKAGSTLAVVERRLR